MNLELKFNLNQKVNIRELEVNGVIKAALFNTYGLQYYVRYFDHAEARSEYFYEDELNE